MTVNVDQKDAAAGIARTDTGELLRGLATQYTSQRMISGLATTEAARLEAEIGRFDLESLA